MNILFLGAVGAMSIDATRDLVKRGGFDELTLADVNLQRLQELARELQIPNNRVVEINASDQLALVELLRGHDVVLNGLPKAFAVNVLRAAIETGANVADLGSPTPDLESLDGAARETRVTYLAGCGATPGITNMLARRGTNRLDKVDQIDVNFAAFRSFGLSPALIHTTLWEFDPEVKERAYYENGRFHSVPPFSGERAVDFPEPIGTQKVYFVPHGETRTFPRTLGVPRVFTRGCFPPRVMLFLRSILQYGFYRTEAISINGAQIGPRELLTQYLLNVPEGNEQDIWAYGLVVEITGHASGKRVKQVFWTTHPGMGEWGIPGAYSRNVALPLAVGVQLLMEGQQCDYGVGPPESLLPEEPFFNALSERGIQIHEKLLNDV